MKKALLGLLVGAVASWVVPAFETKACGHEGAYMGLGYTQLFLFSPEKHCNCFCYKNMRIIP